LNERVENEAIISLFHGNTNEFEDMYPLEYVSTSTNDSLSKDHKTKTELEPITSDNRSTISLIKLRDSLLRFHENCKSSYLNSAFISGLVTHLNIQVSSVYVVNLFNSVFMNNYFHSRVCLLLFSDFVISYIQT